MTQPAVRSTCCSQREWPAALQPAVDYVRENWSEAQQTLGGLVGVNLAVHLLWRVPALQVLNILRSYWRFGDLG